MGNAAYFVCKDCNKDFKIDFKIELIYRPPNYKTTNLIMQYLNMPRTQAKLAIIFYYEKITGCNLYGFLPDSSCWHTPEYKKAVLKARMNLTGTGNNQAAEYLKEFSI